MVINIKKLLILVLSLLSMTVYASNSPEQVLTISKVSTASKQAQMAPKQALLRLKEGNRRFLQNAMHRRDFLAQAKQSSYGQYPWAVILNCMDSRSVPELIFDQGLADLFTLRIAGNVLNDDILGSMEFATKVAGSRLIVVLAHTSCGAVAGACAGVELGHLDHVLNKISPLVSAAKQESKLENCAKLELINTIAKNNALSVARQIREQSPIIANLIAQGKIGIVAGLHDIKTGQVKFFEEGRLLPEQKN